MAKKTFYTIAQAAEFLKVNPQTLRRWDKSKKLQAEKINKRGDRRYDLEKLTNFKDRVRLATDDKTKARKQIADDLRSLESVAKESKYGFELGDHFREARDLTYFILDDEKESNRFQALINLFSFMVDGDEFKSKMSGTDNNGKFWAYPNLEDFSKVDYSFIRSLLPTYKHPRIRSRISHFLWIVEKDHKMAQTAIREYLNVADWLNAEVKRDPEGASAFEILNALKSAYVLAKRIGYSVSDVNISIADIILNFDNQSQSRWSVTHRLIAFALENWKEYGNDFWENTIKICKRMADEQEKKNNLYFARDFLSLGEKIERLVFRLEDKNWRQKIASSFEEEANVKKDGFVQSDLLIKAITEYKALGDQRKVEELEKSLQESKKNLKFQTFSQTMDLTAWIKQIRERFKAFVAKESKEQLLIRLTIDSSILPKYEEVKKQSEKMDKEFPLQSLFSHSVFDSSGNMPRKYDSELEKKYYSILRQYQFSLITHEAMVKVLFEELIEAGKLDLESVTKYMSDRLWYGREYELRDPDDTNKVILKSRKWVDVLRPGIRAYLTTLDMIKNKNFEEAKNNLLLAIDSLTPKIEGLIRELYEIIEKPVDKIKTERGGKQVTEKKGLDELLRDSCAEEVFGNDLLILMKYVLIELGGLNLRNNISHALMFRENYLLSYGYWIFIIILRIGAYPLSIKTEQNQSR
jgi:DNA-binding transcriptional MerR regulator